MIMRIFIKVICNCVQVIIVFVRNLKVYIFTYGRDLVLFSSLIYFTIIFLLNDYELTKF